MDGFGSQVSKARLARGWSQERLAKEAGTTQSTIDRIEKGTTLHSRKLFHVAHVLDIDPPHPFSKEPTGFSESDVAPYKAEIKALDDNPNLSFWIVKNRLLELEGFLPGDLFTLDQRILTPREGDYVCLQAYAPGGLSGKTKFRLFKGSFFITRTADREADEAPLSIYDSNLTIMGVIVERRWIRAQNASL